MSPVRIAGTKEPGTRRTPHACLQCRDRKHKCSGMTDTTSCAGCIARKVACSFREEVRDPRFNPYLRIAARPIELEAISFDNSLPSIPITTPEAIPSPSTSRASARRPSVRTSVESDVTMLKDQIRGLLGRMAHLESQVAKQHPAASGQSEPSPEVNLFTNLTMSTTGPNHPSIFTAALDGPFKTLRDLGAEDSADLEVYDPIGCSTISVGEATALFELFFNHCHPNAPFLDLLCDSVMENVRQSSNLLFLNILVVAARFWGRHRGSEEAWLHPHYQQLVILLDLEMARLMLRPRTTDLSLATVQALLIYAHWMPVDSLQIEPRYRSRFSEISAWQSIGLAIRWATMLGLERKAHVPFHDESTSVTSADIQNYRTMAYLVESDHYLALSARKPPTLDTTPLYNVIDSFRLQPNLQDTDYRLIALLRVAHAAHTIGLRADGGMITAEDIMAFTKKVASVEREFMEASQAESRFDNLGRHFPFTSLRWYRLALACTFIASQPEWQMAGDPFRLSIDWASQILFHLTTDSVLDHGDVQSYEPNPSLVEFLSYAIDHYYVVIAYSASFLILGWQKGAIDNELEALPISPGQPVLNIPSRSSLLFRLVHLAARVLEQCSPSSGHIARRYALLLSRMAEIVGTDSSTGLVSHRNTLAAHANDQMTLNIDENLDLMDLWREIGLDPGLL